MYYSIQYNNFGYLSLLRQYLDKNKFAIRESLNYSHASSIRAQHPLLELLNVKKNDHVNQSWFELYFGLCFDCKCCFTKQIYDKAIHLCSKDEKLKKYQSLIEKNFRQLQQYLN